MVQEIDRWVTQQAIELLAEHHAHGDELTLEVNLSGLSIGDPRAARARQRELERTCVPPQNLVFEITETAAVINMTRAGQFARDLTGLGCRFALDDFGDRLRLLLLPQTPPVRLCQDRRRVRQRLPHQRNRPRADQSSSRNRYRHGQKTIAEHVGDEQTVHLLANLGVDYGQGFHLGRPGRTQRHPTRRRVGRHTPQRPIAAPRDRDHQPATQTMPTTRPCNPDTNIRGTKLLAEAVAATGKSAARRWDSTRSSAERHARREAARADGLAGSPEGLMILSELVSGRTTSRPLRMTLRRSAGGLGAAGRMRAISPDTPAAHATHWAHTIPDVAVDHRTARRRTSSHWSMASPSSGRVRDTGYVTDRSLSQGRCRDPQTLVRSN